MKTIEVEEAVARMFDIRRCIIVPNVSWSLFRYELDLLIVRPSGCGIEVEIKVSKSDLKRDVEKKHNHQNGRIREFYFAVPEKLYAAAVEFAPAESGIIVAEEQMIFAGWEDWPSAKEMPRIRRVVAEIKRPALRRPNYKKFNESEMAYIARLGCMRIWGLKAKLIKLTAQNGKL